MSYSRWSNSIWYTYYEASSRDKSKDEQSLNVCTVGSYTYLQLTTDIESCLDECCGDPIEEVCSADEREELKKYMKQFITDVERIFV